jgi:trimethylguanosine synthase
VSVEVEVAGIPAWVDAARLLGDGDWTLEAGTWRASLSREAAADVAARLRGTGLGGGALAVRVTPPSPRDLVRKARLRDAKRRRDATPGFTTRGAKVDAEGKISLTPEPLALRIAARVRGRDVLDACCGCGGDAIAFAREGCRVTAVDTSETRLALARHNAKLYGVASRIRFVHGDARDIVAKTSHGAVLYVDAPWGREWDKKRTTLRDLPLLAALAPVAAGFRTFLAKVPPSFDPSTLPGTAAEALFGEADGDSQRVKLVLLSRG